jgi:hypothetical protein
MAYAARRPLRTLEYERYEFHQRAPERRTGTLAEFVLDVPYLMFNGVVPPLRVMNAVLRTGGGDAGMSPGTGWKPFRLTKPEYDDLVRHLLAMDLKALRRRRRARYVPARIVVDEALWTCRTQFDWLRRVHEKYP